MHNKSKLLTAGLVFMVVAGALLVIIGVLLIYIPAGIIVAGLFVSAVAWIPDWEQPQLPPRTPTVNEMRQHLRQRG
jgi:hypothetical protein